MDENFEKLQPYLEKTMALNTALTLFSWDDETLAPDGASENTAKVIGILSDEYFKAFINDDVKNLLKKLVKSDKLSQIETKIVKQYKKEFDRLECIPPKDYREYSELMAKASKIWAKAKKTNKFKDFEECLGQIIEYKKKFVALRPNKKGKIYDEMLNEYEEGFNTEILNDFFEKLKKEILPLLKKVMKKKDIVNNDFNSLKYDIDKQLEFSRWISEYIGFDFSKGVIAQSVHPFTTSLHNHDVRITTMFMEDNLESAIFSTIHETGHAIYEMGIPDNITQTPVAQPSCGMHESQSRFFENIIGRSKEFWTPIYPRLKELFSEQLKNVSLDEFIKAINMVQTGLVRTESDELTYCLHIMIRYELEKSIFEGKLAVTDLPKQWNKKYKEYLGVEPKTDTEGVLQDIHWAGGDFGYFPSYAIGNAIAAQIYYHIKEVMPFEKYLEQGNFKPIIEFLNKYIHQYGNMKTTNEILVEMMGEGFNPEYYIKYLKDKYEKIYELN